MSARRGFAETRVLTDWSAILGEGLAGACLPVKVSYAGRKGFSIDEAEKWLAPNLGYDPRAAEVA